MEEIVSKLKNKLREYNVRGLALDIDETLSDTNNHWFEHMLNFHRPERTTKEDLIKKYKFIEEVPEWQTGEASEYARQTLNSNQFNEDIPLIEGADKTVYEINKIIPIVAFITARPVTVREGTLKWLKKHKFPEAELITSPEVVDLDNFNVKKNKWKARVLKELYPEVIGIVDDNVLLAHELENLNYEGTLYLYGKESDEFEYHKQVIVCPRWADVLKSINNFVQF